jgi:enoyl-CoA hydratase/carnithine racemase
MTQSLINADYSHSKICHITINRPEAKNALTGAMYLALAHLLNECDSNDDIRTVLISGDSEIFCAGNDLNDFIESTPTDNQAPPFVFLLALNNFNKPLVAATAGPAIGIGTTMLLHCDHVISATNTLFKMPFVQLGLVPEGGSTYLLPQLIGQRRASELLLLGKSFDSQYAVNIGLINAECAPESLIELALSTCKKFAQQAPKAIQASKLLMKAPFKQHIEQTILSEGKIFIERLQDDEAKEALTAFKEKRKPTF